jgi:hypothetical protein
MRSRAANLQHLKRRKSPIVTAFDYRIEGHWRGFVMRNRFIGLTLLTLLCVIFVFAAGASPVEAAPQEVEVAAPTGGQNALEYVGKVDQDDRTFVAYGYLTHIDGLSDNLLFTDPNNRSETTTRFTYSATASMTGRSIIENIFAVNATGTLTIYFNEAPKSDFKDAKTFASGVAIASYAIRAQSIINVISPNTGLNTAIIEATQQNASGFKLDSAEYVFGHPKLLHRYSHTGFGKRSNVEPPRAVIVVAGYAVVAGTGD